MCSRACVKMAGARRGMCMCNQISEVQVKPGSKCLSLPSQPPDSGLPELMKVSFDTHIPVPSLQSQNSFSPGGFSSFFFVFLFVCFSLSRPSRKYVFQTQQGWCMCELRTWDSMHKPCVNSSQTKSKHSGGEGATKSHP